MGLYFKTNHLYRNQSTGTSRKLHKDFYPFCIGCWLIYRYHLLYTQNVADYNVREKSDEWEMKENFLQWLNTSSLMVYARLH